MGKETRMKRYDDVNIIKAYACLAVFGSHWFGTFGSWGSNKVNALMEIGPLPLFRYGTFGVSLFLIRYIPGGLLRGARRSCAAI